MIAGKRILILAVALTIVGAGLPAPPAVAGGVLALPTASPAGTYGGMKYLQYDGTFSGRTSTGDYRVPYRITAPADPVQGNQTVLVEPPHPGFGLGALEHYLGPDLLFPRGFVHAGIGWSTATFGKGFDLRILDPTVPGVFIKGGFHEKNGRTDDEIIVDFARAVATDRNAKSIVGRVDRRYITGFSDSSDPVLRLVASGRAAGVFDLAMPFTAEGHDPQDALAAGRYGGKLIIVNSEADAPTGLVDRGGTPNQYRYFAVAGTAHIPDFLGFPFFTNMSTPASFAPALRAHFLQGHGWVTAGTPPPSSTHLQASDDGTLARDVSGNAISVNASGRPVPRLPSVELGEAHFISGFVGSYENVKTIGELGFRSHNAYLQAFAGKLADYQKAGYILKEDADAMRSRAALCPPLTFTQTYRDYYDQFVAIRPCTP